MFSEYTVKCRICGEPYVVYAYYAGDQSACPDCRRKARKDSYSSSNLSNYFNERMYDIENNFIKRN